MPSSDDLEAKLNYEMLQSALARLNALAVDVDKLRELVVELISRCESLEKKIDARGASQ